MTNRQIETSREIRLWVTGVIGPVLIGAATIFAYNPELLGKTGKYLTKKGKELKTKIIGRKETN